MGETREPGPGARHSRGAVGADPGTLRLEPGGRVPAWDDMVLVGRVARPHGLRGQVVVDPETDFVHERFQAGGLLWTREADGDRALRVIASQVQGRRPVVAFAGCETVDDARRLAGRELRVPEDALRPLPEGVYYQHELVGCVVETVAGHSIGEVARVSGGASGSLLAIDGSRGEILIPLAAEICVEVDVAARRIRIQPPDGLLDLNETKRDRRSRRSTRP